MFGSEAIGPAVTATPPLAAVTTVFLLFLGTPTASATADDARPGGAPPSPARRR